MTGPSIRLCGGRLEVNLRTRYARVDGQLVVTFCGMRCARWDGEPVSDVIAEALAIAWEAAEGE